MKKLITSSAFLLLLVSCEVEIQEKAAQYEQVSDQCIERVEELLQLPKRDEFEIITDSAIEICSDDTKLYDFNELICYHYLIDCK